MSAAAPQELVESWRPRADEELLLHAALGEGGEAVEAWRRWREIAGVESVDVGSLRLLPAAYVNLTRLGVEPTALSKMRGVHRQHWYRARLLLARLQSAMDQAERSGVQAMVSHAAAIALLPDVVPGLSESSMAVRRGDAPAAARLFEESGWRAVRAPRYGLTPSYLHAEHCCAFADADGLRCVLHWSVFDRRIAANDERALFAGAVEAEIDGKPVRAMNPTDLLLLVAIRAQDTWLDRDPTWVLDGATLLRRAAIDWDRMLRVGHGLGLLGSLAAPLRYLQTWCAGSISDGALTRIEAAPVPMAERLFRAAHGRGGQGGAAVYRLLRHWRRYRMLRGEPASAGPVGFATYLKEAYGLERAAGVPAHLARGLRRRLPAR